MGSIKREGTIAIVIVALTIAIIFPLTFFVGARTLGPYGADGGLGQFMGSLLNALGDGSAAIWFFLLTPLLAISTVRLGWLIFRRL